MGDRGEPGARPADWVAAVAAVLVVLAVTAGLAERTRAIRLERQRAEDHEVVARVAVGLGAEVRAAADAIESIAPTAGVAAAAGQVDRLSAAIAPAVYVPADREASSLTAPLTAADLASPEVAAVLARARDTGRLLVSDALQLTAGPRLLVVSPSYVQPATDVDGRRAGLAGWLVRALDLGAVASEHLTDEEGAVVSVGDTAFEAARRPHDGAEQTLSIRGLPMTIRAGRAGGLPISGGTIALVVVGVLAALVAGAVARAVVLRLRDLARRVERSDAQTELIAQVAPMAQQSLDLGEVLPAVAVQLRDGFDLRGIQVSTGARHGQLELFSLGERPADPGPLVLAPPSELAPGESFTLALQRGGRSVAHLQVTAGRPLDPVDLNALAVLAELVTGAVINASLYASEQEAVRRLRDLDALKTVFLSTASHELRTPVTAITGFASLLVDGWDRFPEPQRQELVGRIAANARSLVAVVQDLLDFSLLDRRDQPLPAEPIDLAPLAAGVVDRLSALFAEHDIDVQVTPGPPVAGERNALERIITNLLTNAAKYSPEGTTITVSVGGDDSRGWVVVSDQGPGVPEDERVRIFTRFYRGSGEAEMRSRGVGIGLSVVAELVQRLGGSVEVGEAAGGGARFRVELPTWVVTNGATAPEREVDGAPTR